MRWSPPLRACAHLLKQLQRTLPLAACADGADRCVVDVRVGLLQCSLGLLQEAECLLPAPRLLHGADGSCIVESIHRDPALRHPPADGEHHTALLSSAELRQHRCQHPAVVQQARLPLMGCA